MKILLLSFGYIEYTVPLANSLSKNKGVEVFLLEPRNRITPVRKLIQHQVRVKPFDVPRLRSIANLVMLFRLIREIRNIAPSVIHVQRGHPWLNIGLTFLRSYPLVLTVHDVTLHPGDRSSSKIPWFVYKMAQAFADQIIVHGKRLKDKMVNGTPIAAERINVITRGDYQSYYDFKAAPHQRFKLPKLAVLFFGRIWEYKGLRYLIEAQQLISQQIPGARIVIAGYGENMTKYQKMMRQPESFMVFNEHIPDENVSEIFRKAAVVVLPYTEASQSGIIPLAYAFKKPVVVTKVGSLPEVVEHGKTGYIVPPKNAPMLAKAIVDLLKNDRLRSRMGDLAWQKVKNEQSWDISAERTLLVYRKAIRFKKKGCRR